MMEPPALTKVKKRLAQKATDLKTQAQGESLAIRRLEAHYRRKYYGLDLGTRKALIVYSFVIVPLFIVSDLFAFITAGSWAGLIFGVFFVLLAILMPTIILFSIGDLGSKDFGAVVKAITGVLSRIASKAKEPTKKE